MTIYSLAKLINFNELKQNFNYSNWVGHASFSQKNKSLNQSV